MNEQTVDETTKQEHVIEQVIDKEIQTDKIVESKEDKETEEIKQKIDKLENDIRLERDKNYLKDLEQTLEDLRKPKIGIESSSSVKTSKPLTVYEASKMTASQQKIGNIGDNKNQLLQIPMEELLDLLGVSSEDVIGLEDRILYNLCDDLSGGKNNRLIVKVITYKNKLIKEKEEDKQRLKIEEDNRKLKEERDRKLAEDQAKKAKEDQIRRTYDPCPYCSDIAINRKTLIKYWEARCMNCGKKVDFCVLCEQPIIPESEKEHNCSDNMSLTEAFNILGVK